MIRITGGELRGRSLRTPRQSERGEDRTRPTQAKLRQALFNSLQMHIPGAKLLDLFAGPGTLGFEALSRGAERVVFVEEARSVSKLISDNARELGVEDRVRVFPEAMEKTVLRLASSPLREEAPFDIILADPPYAGGFELELLEKAPWAELLTPDGYFCLEWGMVKSQVTELPERAGAGGILVKVREKNYGDSVLTTYRRETPRETLNDGS